MKTKSLTQVCNITTGKLDANAGIPNGKYPFFTCAPDPLRIDTFAFDDDVVLLAGNNAQGNFHIQRFKGKFNAYQRTYVITARDGYDIDYVKYSLELSLQHLKRIAQGSQTKFLTMQILDSFRVVDIPYNAQRHLIGSIREVDSKISLNTCICAELESMAKMLYDYWFTQFDFPDENGKPYRSSGGEMVWNDQLNREIPKGWYSSVIANHIGVSKGGDWGKEVPEGKYQKEVVCIRGADFPSINGSKPLNAPVRYILSKNADKILLSGDIIVEISGGSPTQSTGRICYINDYTLKRFDKEIITSNFCKAFSTKKASEQYWLYLLWKTLYDAGVLFGFEGKTTGIKNLLFDDFCAQYRIVAPDETILQKFHEVVSPIFDKIQQYNIENDELTRLRDWLLPMLMNGQATVE